MPTKPNKRGGDRESEKEFRIMIVKKIQERFNKDLEEIKQESISNE